MPRISISGRAILISALLVFTVGLALISYFPDRISRDNYEHRRRYDETLSTLVTALARQVVATGDTLAFSNALRSADTNASLAFVAIIDKAGAPLFLLDYTGAFGDTVPLPVGLGSFGNQRIGGIDIHISANRITADNGNSAQVLVGTDLSQTRQQVADSNLMILIFATSIVIVGILIILVFSRSLVRPLAELTRTAGKVADGDFKIGEMPITTPEFGQLAEAFRKIVAKIKTQMSGLRESEARYRSVVENAHEGILILRDGKIIFVNSTLTKITGYEDGELDWTKPLQYIFPADRLGTIRAIQRVARGTGKVGSWDCRVIDKSGEIHNLRATGTAITWDESKACMVFVSDVTAKKKDEDALKLTRFVMDRISDCAFWIDSSGRFVYLNEAACVLCDRDRADFNELRIYDIHDDLDRQTWSDLWREIVQKTHVTYDSAIAARHGDSVPVEVSANHLEFRGEEYCCLVVRDVTERRKWEERLQRLAEYPKGSPDMVLSFNREGEVLYRNPAVKRTLESLELESSEIHKILPAGFLEKVADCLTSGATSDAIESRYDQRAWLWNISPMTGQPIVHVHALDISKRLEAEGQMRSLSAAVEQSHNTIIITDIDGLIEYANRKFEQVTGMALEEVRGLDVSIIKSGLEGPQEYAAIWNAVDSDNFWTGNLKNRQISGRYYWARESVSPIYDQHGETIGYLFVGQDITKEIELQQKVIESDKLSAVGMLAAGVAHEFKNYLGGIIGNASFALEDLDTEGGLELARNTLQEVITLGEKANDVAMALLTYSRANPDEVAPEDLKAIIDKSINLVEKEMSTLDIEVVFYHEDLPPVNVSASKIQQLLLNLLINAQHAIKSHGVITIALLREGNEVKIKIGDTGCGIPDKILSRIFDPFFSTKGVWGRHEVIGTGMGLAICRNIAREHGGDLRARSIVGVGTNFVLSLPLGEDDHPSRGTQRDLEEKRIILFSLDHDIVSSYFKEGAPQNLSIIPVDNFAKMPEDLASACDLVICDARFSAKVELFRTGDLCKENDVPYVMVNCGAMEYQLRELYDDAAACFKGATTLDKIADFCRGNSTVKA